WTQRIPSSHVQSGLPAESSAVPLDEDVLSDAGPSVARTGPDVVDASTVASPGSASQRSSESKHPDTPTAAHRALAHTRENPLTPPAYHASALPRVTAKRRRTRPSGGKRTRGCGRPRRCRCDRRAANICARATTAPGRPHARG